MRYPESTFRAVRQSNSPNELPFADRRRLLQTFFVAGGDALQMGQSFAGEVEGAGDENFFLVSASGSERVGKTIEDVSRSFRRDGLSRPTEFQIR